MTDHEPVLVDQPERPKNVFVTALARPHTERRPIIPAALRSWKEIGGLLRWWVEHLRHVTAYHATRSPLYLWRIAARAPLGLLHILKLTLDWITDAESRPLRVDAVNRYAHDDFHRLRAEQKDQAQRRLLILIATAVPATVGLVVLWMFTGTLIHIALVLLAIAVLGKAGSPQDKPLTDRAVLEPQVRRLTSDEVVRALKHLGNSTLTSAIAKDPNAVTFRAPITMDGPGWLAQFDPPAGVTCTDIMAERERLASNLGRPLGCVWISGNAAIHPGRVNLWVGNEDLSKAKQPRWRFVTTGIVDVFEPQPFVTDRRQQWIPVTLAYAAMVIGSVPRMGKTVALRVLLLLAALDPRTEVHAYDLKGTGDLDPLKPIAHRLRAGDDRDDIEYLLYDLRAIQEDIRRRAKVIRELPREMCPESKVTSKLASKRSLKLHPVVLGMDECQRAFEHPDHGKEITAICEDIVRRGPALGIISIFATQRPDAKSLPKGISDNAVLRYCLKVLGHVANDMVLGSGMHKAGIQATQFKFHEKGIGILVGEGEEPSIGRTPDVDGPTAEAIVARALEIRRESGYLTGEAAGEPNERPSYDLLEDILRVINLADGERMWSETVCRKLTELRPTAYEGWGPDQLAAALKPLGVTTKQIWQDGQNRKGIHRSDVLSALEARLPNHALESDKGAERYADASR